jgi:3-methylfumaryl-CoA hydratase
MNPTDEDIAHWQTWVGKTESVTERIEPMVLRRYAAALGESYEDGCPLPSLAHWAFFIAAEQPGNLGPDGHPKRGGFLPPISLPRRMFAASDMRFEAPLIAGRDATRRSRVASLTPKNGKSGSLILVDVVHEIFQDDALCVSETQTIVYRDMGTATPPVEDKGLAVPLDAVLWAPGAVDLFRFSAVTFNSHRIHYDLPYAREEEGYPGLVVHGPFTAARLFGLARQRNGPLSRFSFRAQAPVFANQTISLQPGTTAGEVLAKRCDGTDAMSARFEICS